MKYDSILQISDSGQIDILINLLYIQQMLQAQLKLRHFDFKSIRQTKAVEIMQQRCRQTGIDLRLVQDDWLAVNRR